MEGEIQNFFKVWILAIASLTYCYFIVSKLIPKGFLRLVSLLPVFYLLTILPLNLSSLHLGVPTTSYLTWFGNFKLLLFSFNHGPLSSSKSEPPKPFLLFISLACLPIRIKQNPSLKKSQSNESLHHQNPPLESTQNLVKPQKNTFFKNTCLILALKALLIPLVVHIYDYRQNLNPNINLALICCYLYLIVEIILKISGFLARALLGQDLEPEFDEPYLSTSLQDFWSRRWNLVASSILRSTIYDPVRRISTPILGIMWAGIVGVFFTFLVSGLMHEVLNFYYTRVDPTWEVTCFFVLHGICMNLEVVVKKKVAHRYQLQPWVSRPLTIGFVMVTGSWLFFPQILRNGADVDAMNECRFFLEFVKNKMKF